MNTVTVIIQLQKQHRRSFLVQYEQHSFPGIDEVVVGDCALSSVMCISTSSSVRNVILSLLSEDTDLSSLFVLSTE